MANFGVDPWTLMSRRADARQLADFFEALEEGIDVAFVDALRQVPGKRTDRPAVVARGNYRRWQFDAAFRSAAQKNNFPLATGITNPPTWTYPLIRTGAFSVTIGIVDKPFVSGRRRLRCRGKYMRRHVERNNAIDPQGRLAFARDRVTTVIPNGSLGAVVVVEGSLYEPDRPRYVGVWIPSANLSHALHAVSLRKLIGILRKRGAAQKSQNAITTERKGPIRKLPVRKAIRRKSGDQT